MEKDVVMTYELAFLFVWFMYISVCFLAITIEMLNFGTCSIIYVPVQYL